MKSPQRLDEIAATPSPPAPELRDWSQLADMALGDVLRRLAPCLRSLSAFAATCGPWRRFFLASASTILQLIPPLILSGHPYHYTSLTPTSCSSPSTRSSRSPSRLQTPPPAWTHHRLPREASFVTAVIEFRGSVLGVTDRAQLLESRLDDPDHAAQLLPTTGILDDAAFERWQIGPRLVAAGEWLLIMTDLEKLCPQEKGRSPQIVQLFQKED